MGSLRGGREFERLVFDPAVGGDLAARAIVVDLAVAVVVLAIADLCFRQDLAFARKNAVFAGSNASLAGSASEGSSGAFVTREGFDIVDQTVAIVVDLVAKFRGRRIDFGVLVIAVAVVWKAVFVGVFDRLASPFLAELIGCTSGGTGFLADPVDAD